MNQTSVQRSALFGWYMYDWANSAFATTVLAALFGPYLDRVVLPAGGYTVHFFGMHTLTATSLYGYTLGLSALLVFLFSPVLGAIADYTASKKKFLIFFCYLGSTATLLFATVGPGDVLPALFLFFVANFSFIAGNVFYDAFLPHLAEPEKQDVVSGKGYAFGYAGGGFLFLVHLLLVQFHASLGIADQAVAMRIALGSVGLWWGGFALITFSRLKEEAVDHGIAPRKPLLHIGVSRVVWTLKRLASLKQLALYLVAFMIYNDGIQTIIAMATVYASEELQFGTLTLMGCLLMVQAVGIVGSTLLAKLASRFGTKPVVLFTLVVWSGIAIFGFLMTKPVEFWILGILVGIVLGGSQALSRSLYSKVIPVHASAEFFGFFSIFEKFSAIWGPIVFAVVREVTGSSRYSILSLIGFFIIGFVLLAFVNLKKARQEGEKLEDALLNERM